MANASIIVRKSSSGSNVWRVNDVRNPALMEHETLAKTLPTPALTESEKRRKPRKSSGQFTLVLDDLKLPVN